MVELRCAHMKLRQYSFMHTLAAHGLETDSEGKFRSHCQRRKRFNPMQRTFTVASTPTPSPPERHIVN